MHALINYSSRRVARPRYYANDHSRDTVEVEPQDMAISDARKAGTHLDVEGFMLARHDPGAIDFYDRDAIANFHGPEVAGLLKQTVGADHVSMSAGGLLRFSEKTGRAGTLNNSMPARFVHVDVSARGADQVAGAAPEGMKVARRAHYNIWRIISCTPTDVPLTLCDGRSIAPADYIPADAIFDMPGQPDWSFEALVVAHNPAHRWMWFPDITVNEPIIFKTYDTDPDRASLIPHVAFDNPLAPADAIPRVSIELRAVAYWAA